MWSDTANNLQLQSSWQVAMTGQATARWQCWAWPVATKEHTKLYLQKNYYVQNPQSNLPIGAKLAVGMDQWSVSTGCSRMLSVPKAGCHMGHSRELVGTVYWRICPMGKRSDEAAFRKMLCAVCTSSDGRHQDNMFGHYRNLGRTGALVKSDFISHCAEEPSLTWVNVTRWIMCYYRFDELKWLTLGTY